MRRRLGLFIGAAVALLLGGSFYLGRGMTRAEEVLPWFAQIVRPVRASAIGPVVHSLPRVVRDTAPDALWSFALAMALSALAPRASIGLWRVAGFLFAIGFELGQGLGIVRGTFDAKDLLAITVAYVFAIAIASSSSSSSSSTTPSANPLTTKDLHETSSSILRVR
jgi:hypothetical protein